MALEPDAVGAVDQRVAGDARGLLVRLAEAAVYHEQLAAGLDRTFALFGLDGGVTVDDVAAVGVKAELGEYHARRVLVVPVAEVGVARLSPGALVVDHRALERVEHAAGEGAVVAAPEVPHHVQRTLVAADPCALDHGVGVVHQRLAGVPPAAVADAGELAVLRKRYAAVEQQIAVAGEIGTAALVYEVQVPPERLAVAEGVDVLVHERALLGRQFVGVGGVDGRQVGGVQRIDARVQAHRPVVVVYAVEHQPVVHVVAGVAHDDLTLQLEAEYGQRQLARLLVRGAVNALAELGQRAQRHAVAALERQLVVVVAGDAQHREHAGRGAGRRAQPEYVVVAPLYVYVPLAHEQLHHAGRLRPAVEDVAHDVQPVHR